MSSSDRMREIAGMRRLACMALCAALVASALPGCTVRPLYATQGGTASTVAGRLLPSVDVKQVKTRYALGVRNQLIFLLYGGAAPPVKPAYSLDLGVTSATRITTRIQRELDEQATSATVSLISDYHLTELATGKIIASGHRQTIASYDRPRQEFAAYRAQLDAQDRAARELAELVNLAVAQDLERIAK